MRGTSRSLLRVLIVDDNEADRILHQRLLNRSRDYEFIFAEAEGTEDVLEEMKRSTPDCVLLDYSLPNCDGLEVIADPEFSKYEVPVVMLTGVGTVAVAKNAMMAGVHDCLSKRNATSDGLLTAIVDAISASDLTRLAMRKGKRPAKSRAAPHQLGNEPTADKRQCVLLVNDESDIRRRVARQLRDRGCDVVEAVNFSDARRQLARERHEFSFLLTGVHLGDGLGIDLARAVNGQGCRLPVLMMAGNGSFEYAVEALRLGVVDLLAKAFNDSDLDRALARIESAQAGTRALTA